MSLWFLIVLATRGGESLDFVRSPYPTRATCVRALRDLRLAVGPGDENESTVIAWCTPGPIARGLRDGYGKQWWQEWKDETP